MKEQAGLIFAYRLLSIMMIMIWNGFTDSAYLSLRYWNDALKWVDTLIGKCGENNEDGETQFGDGTRRETRISISDDSSLA
jgi:hypothetical protein